MKFTLAAFLNVTFSCLLSDCLPQERGSAGGGQTLMEMLKQTLQSFPVPDELNWWSREGDKAEVFEKSWTDIVHSHKVRERRLDTEAERRVRHVIESGSLWRVCRLGWKSEGKRTGKRALL